MEIKITQEQGRVPVTIVHASGRIDSSTHEELEQQAKKAIDAGARHLLLDLRDVEFMSSAGLRAMHSIFLTLRSLSPEVSKEEMNRGISAGTYKSPHLKLLAPRENVRKAINLAGFDMYLDIHKDLKTAVASF
jgi:anti-sigma B factor antagonist